MSTARPYYHYDLNKITEFDHALMYGFDCELSSKQGTQQISAEYIAHGANQHEDMFNAYYYAQEVILKSIRERGIQRITPSDILSWLDALHQRIAVALAADINEPQMAGHYTIKQINRWHQTTAVQNAIMLKFLGERGHQLTGMATLENGGFSRMMEELGVSTKVANQFIQLLHKYYKKEIPLITESEKATVYQQRNPIYYDQVLPMTKLISAYHLNLLDSHEKRLVESLFKVCCRPEEIPARMKQYAERVTMAWQQCDKNNLDEVAELCRLAFYEGTETHPYFNCNGRTFTCFINIIARSLGHASFLMRNPGERSDEKSSYSIAIKHIDTNPELLKAHIRLRIIDANKGKNYLDASLAEVIRMRIEVAKLIFSFTNEFPRTDINTLLIQESSQIPDSFALLNYLASKNHDLNKLTENVIGEFNLLRVTEKLAQKLSELRRSKAAALVTPVVQRHYSGEEQRIIITKLEALTGLVGWKAYPKEGLQILLEVDTSANAINLAKALAKTNAMQAKHMLIRNTEKSTILLQSIKMEQLSAIFTLEGWTRSNAPNMVAKVANQ